MCRSLSVLVLVLGLAASASAQETPDQHIASARELIMYANYRDARPQVEALLARTDLDAQQRNAGLEMLATIELALRDEAGAREVLSQLYARDPGHRLRDADASPLVQSAFARAREGATPISITIEHAPPTLTRRVAAAITARITENADAVHEVRVAYRQRGERRWTQVVLGIEDSEARGRIPLVGDDDAAYTIEYYLEALAPSTTVLASAGSIDAPLAFEVPAQSVAIATATQTDAADEASSGGGDLVSEPWLWIVIGVVVVGGAVGAGVGVAMASEGPENGSLGNVDLPLLRF